ncbi:MAG: hypothetical protein K2L93_04315, partial [Muribaculaceae bacterium]|nr:hypothetical protein [Muribaculaceae bacterium]
MNTSTPHWLKSIGYIFIGICLAVTAYSAYMSISDQEDKELEDKYKENLKTLTVTDASGIREIPDESMAQESTEDSASGIEGANLGDDLSSEEVIVADDGEEQLG